MLRRLDALQTTMTLVLEFGFVQSAGLPLEGVIALVCRCLAVSTDQLLQAGQVLLASVIPRIHVVALRILESVVGAARGHTQVHAGTISTVLRQALRRSPPQGRLRAAVYDALKRVMLVLGPVIQLPDLDQIVGAALQDCSKQTVSGEGAAEGGAGAGGAAAAAAGLLLAAVDLGAAAPTYAKALLLPNGSPPTTAPAPTPPPVLNPAAPPVCWLWLSGCGGGGATRRGSDGNCGRTI